MTLPSELPRPDQLKLWMRSMAVLDAVLSPEWEYRYYSFNARWSDSEEMGSVRNGSGDETFVLFNSAGCYMKGFAHEYPTQYEPQQFYKDVPSEFMEAVTEPAFSADQINYCYWYLGKVGKWESSIPTEKLDKEIFFLLQDLNGRPATYKEFAADYFEVDVDVDIVKSIYLGDAITESMAMSLNPATDFAGLIEELVTIGYPFEK